MEYVPAKSIVNRTKDSSWFGIDYNMNIYRGCCHGCIYCDSRSECYHVENFDTVRAKQDALRIVRDELRRKVKTGVVGTGAMSDPYNPFEQQLELTRHSLELIDAFGFGAAIATKSDLITRDIDVLQGIRQHSPVLCKVTVTTCDDDLAAKIEPHVTRPSGRFAAVEKLSGAGIYAGLLLMPVLPFLEDNEENLLTIVRRASDCGARFIYPALGMTLRLNQRDYYLDKLDQLFPGQELRQKYERRYGTSYECRVPRLKTLWKVFTAECDRLGILYNMRDIVSSYKLGYANSQLSLF